MAKLDFHSTPVFRYNPQNPKIYNILFPKLSVRKHHDDQVTLPASLLDNSRDESGVRLLEFIMYQHLDGKLFAWVPRTSQFSSEYFASGRFLVKFWTNPEVGLPESYVRTTASNSAATDAYSGPFRLELTLEPRQVAPAR